MKTKKPYSNDRSGMTLFVVMGMTLLCAAAVSSVLFTVGARMHRAYKQVYLEQAFYIAEAGIEHAAAWVAAGNEYDKEWIDVEFGDGSYVATVTCSPLPGGEIGIEVVSTGTINKTSRTITVRGLRRISWARDAFSYDDESVALNIAAGDTFGGPFYSRPLMRFSSPASPTSPQAHFYDRALTGAGKPTYASGAVPIYDQGLTLHVDRQEIANVDFSKLKAAASTNPNGLVLNGNATIELDGPIMRVTNKEKNWIKHEMPIPEKGIVYASAYAYEEEYQSWWGLRTRTVTEPGDITVSAPNGLNGELTLVAEESINITDHIRYTDNPKNNPEADDKLGLIAGKHAIVKPSAPNNVDIFAHIFCRNGGFGVENYDRGNHRGYLNVYGGIANRVRYPVGIVNGAGYLKNYVYDPRFAQNPPPYYPRLVDVLAWDGWEG